MPLQQFRSHKIVQAAKIVAVHDGKLVLAGEEEGPYYELVDAPAFFTKRVKPGEPASAGYLVVYADGYESWSPADAFEQGYHPIEMEYYGSIATADLLKELTFRMQGDDAAQCGVASLFSTRALIRALHGRGIISDVPEPGDDGVAGGMEN